ncbi:hypothetical protein PV04_03385 [Phialophora macrospora]|uniref:DUF6594 domain-containing protein n=1 Tax=Phialophora macrospora TaxID=1851006 RepID=A0A0D2GG28_9EURO|nr:hypothetical protein PV04_03385 [Phialophora macrospora]
MAAAVAPVELPTSRRSYYNTSTPVDIHDPNWIPILDSAAYRPQLSPTEKEVFQPQPPASFSLFPSQPNSPKPRPGFSHGYSKSSMAPESVTSDSDSRSQSPQDSIEPLPSIPSHIQSPPDASRGHNRQTTSTTAESSEEKISVGTETQRDTAGTPSTDDNENASVVDDRASSQQSQPMEQIVESTVNPSMRSSMVSVKRSVVLPPTSKYNRKPMASATGSTPGRPSLVPSLPQTPQESPRLVPSVPAASTAFTSTEPKLPPFELAQYPEPSPRLQAAKSSASERRQRALHSHPSNLSLRSQRNSSSDDAENIPKQPLVRNKSRKSTDSRATTPRSTIYESQLPTPAPTTPLPQLPPEAHMQSRRPSTRDNGSRAPPQPPVEEPVPSTISSFRRIDHARVASFMTEKNTIVLRRFDDVHARLLLSLQDEISQLEQELEKLESPTSSGSASERMLAKTRVLRELRKVVAEYDHLFNTWSKMQASQASESTTKELKQWLSKPGTNPEAGLGISTQQTLQWLENTKDLSSIELGDEENAPSIRKEKPSSAGGGTSGGGGGFLAFFSCAGKRK